MRWGIVGIGGISKDFAFAVAKSKSVLIVACSSARTSQKPTSSAMEYADMFGIPKVFESPDKLIESNEVDIVYIGARNEMHYDLVKRALHSRKAVICEKPLTISLTETQDLVKHARSEKVFLAEGYWSRYFPAIRRALELVQKGEIGDIYSVYSDFGVNAVDIERFWLPGCGGLVDLGCYTLQLPTMIYGCRPETLSSVVTLNRGVDSQGIIGMSYLGGRIASAAYSGLNHTPCEAVICGTKGIIKLPFSFHCPDKLEITMLKSRTDRKVSVENFPLPETLKPYPFTYPNSEGLIYEAEEIDRCVAAGLCESPLMPLEDTVIVAEMMDTVSKQHGLFNYASKIY